MRPDNPGTALVASDGGDRAVAVCNLCEAVDNGNATCWACVDRWEWMRSDRRAELVATLRERTPGKPVGAEEVRAFADYLERRFRDRVTIADIADAVDAAAAPEDRQTIVDLVARAAVLRFLGDFGMSGVAIDSAHIEIRDGVVELVYTLPTRWLSFVHKVTV